VDKAPKRGGVYIAAAGARGAAFARHIIDFLSSSAMLVG
jgi:hypothetical protein